jgi:hypothetical protein
MIIADIYNLNSVKIFKLFMPTALSMGPMVWDFYDSLSVTFSYLYNKPYFPSYLENFSTKQIS